MPADPEVVAMNGGAQTRVIVAAGASLADLEALRYAVAQARARRAALHVVSNWRTTPAWQGAGLQQWRDALAEEAVAAVRDSFDSAMAGVPEDLDVQVSVVEGTRGPALVDYANRDSDLLVVGGHTGPRRWRWASAM
jgi:nucleotide-binding universal stress UspA family protein